MKYKYDRAGDLQGFSHEVSSLKKSDHFASTRALTFADSRYSEFIGDSMIDLFKSKGYLKSGVCKITYMRSTPDFYMLVRDSWPNLQI